MHVVVNFAIPPEQAPKVWTWQSVDRFLEEAVKITGLTRVGDPVVKECGDLLIGFQIIAESHVSVHLDRGSGRGWADVFSCGEVDEAKVAKVVDATLMVPGGMLTIGTLPRGNLEEGGEPCPTAPSK